LTHSALLTERRYARRRRRRRLSLFSEGRRRHRRRARSRRRRHRKHNIFFFCFLDVTRFAVLSKTFGKKKRASEQSRREQRAERVLGTANTVQSIQPTFTTPKEHTRRGKKNKIPVSSS